MGRDLRKGEMNHQGVVMIESAIAITLFAIIILGFAQVYSVVLEKMKHIQVATEMLMGPQERSLQFDTANGVFEMLGNATTPTLQEFQDQLGNFFVSRNLQGAVLHVKLGYISVKNDVTVQDDTGKTVDPRVGARTAIATYPSSAGAPCNTSQIKIDLDDYADSVLQRMHGYTNPSTGKTVEVGTKLYDVTIGGQRYKGYVDFIPIVFMTICSEPYTYLFPQTVVSTYELVPRRLVN